MNTEANNISEGLFNPFLRSALRFSIRTHEVYQKQKRKGKDIPYITHPLAVGLILSRAGASDDVIAAGVLHDTIEDSIPEKKVTYEMLHERFGNAVADTVLSVTETDKTLPWKERKRKALEHIETFSEASLLVKAADTVSNVNELLDDYERKGEEIFLHFGSHKKDVVANYQAIAAAILKQWPEIPLAADLKALNKRLSSVQYGENKKV